MVAQQRRAQRQVRLVEDQLERERIAAVVRRRQVGEVGRGRGRRALGGRTARIEDDADGELVARRPVQRRVRPPVAAGPDEHRLQTLAGLVTARTQLQHEVVRQRPAQYQVQATAVLEQPQHGVGLVREAEVARRQRALPDPFRIAAHRRRGRAEHADRQLTGPNGDQLVGLLFRLLFLLLLTFLLIFLLLLLLLRLLQHGRGRGVSADEVAARAQAGRVAGLNPVVVARFGLHLSVDVGAGGAAGVLDQHLELAHRAVIAQATQDLVTTDRRVAGVVPAQTDRIVADHHRLQRLGPPRRLELGRLRQRHRSQDRRQQGRRQAQRQPTESAPGPPPAGHWSHLRSLQAGSEPYTINVSIQSGSDGF